MTPVICYHEAAHALIGRALGVRVERVELREGSVRGFVTLPPECGDSLAVCVAGMLGEAIYRRVPAHFDYFALRYLREEDCGAPALEQDAHRAFLLARTERGVKDMGAAEDLIARTMSVVNRYLYGNVGALAALARRMRKDRTVEGRIVDDVLAFHGVPFGDRWLVRRVPPWRAHDWLSHLAH